MILITGATGTTGGELAQILTQKGLDFIVGARDAEKAGRQFPGQQTVRLDWDDPATFAPALAGVDRIYLLGIAFTPDFDRQAAPFITAAKNAGVQHVVYLSLVGTNSGLDNTAGRIERMLEQSGLDYTFLRPNFFSQNFLKYDLPFIRQGQIYLPTAEGKAAYVDTRDIAEMAAAALTDPGAHRNKAYELSGPEAISHYEAAQIFTEELGRPVAFLDPAPEAYVQTLAGAGLPLPTAEFAAEIYGFIRNGWVANVSPDIPNVLGRPARSFRQFVVDHRSALDN